MGNYNVVYATEAVNYCLLLIDFNLLALAVINSLDTLEDEARVTWNLEFSKITSKGASF